MKKTLLLCLANVLLITMSLLAGCALLRGNLESPNVSLADLWVKDVGLLEQRFGLKLRRQNPNDVALLINGMRYDVKLNGKKFARGVSAKAITVPAFGEELVEVDMVSNLGSILAQMRDLGRDQAFHYSLSGSLDVANVAFKVPFEYDGEISLSGGP